MLNWSYHSIIKKHGEKFFLPCFLCFFLIACQNLVPDDRHLAQYNKIKSPFDYNKQIDTKASQAPFIIRTISDNIEYVIEIPSAGEDYNIEIPIAQLKGSLPKTKKHFEEHHPSSTSATDKEILKDLPQIVTRNVQEIGRLDRAFGLTKEEMPSQAPSYILGLAKIGELYKGQEYEYALIETNHLLTIYPNSPKLLKMKGSLYLRLGNPRLTLKAWKKALELEPGNIKLQAAMDRLKKISLKKVQKVQKVQKVEIEEN